MWAGAARHRRGHRRRPAYPILPRHLTAIDGLTIGIPAFFLALAPNFRRFVPGFAYRVARFVIPTGFLSAVLMLASFLTLRELGATMPQAQTMEIIIFAAVGLRVISVIERPLRGWRLGLVLAIVACYIFGFWWSVTVNFFAVVWPTELGGGRGRPRRGASSSGSG